MMAYQFDKALREESAHVLDCLKDRLYLTGQMDEREHKSLCFAIGELLRPNPCDNCVGVGLAVSRGYTDMRLKTEEDE